MTSPSCQEIINLAKDFGYEERRNEASKTLFFHKKNDGDYPTLINVFYTTRGVMTKVSHPTKGYNQLWRSDAYDSLETLGRLFENPRIHTGKGYRTADQAVRGCIQCGRQRKREEFSKNQWRKGSGASKCHDCVAGKEEQIAPSSSSGSTQAQQQQQQVSREYITCDAAGCESVAPAIRCDSCHMAYYCSQACQTRHLYEHAQDPCIPIEQMRARHKTSNEKADGFHMRGWAMATQLSGKRTFKALLAQAEYIYQADGQWESALELYKQLLMRDQSVGTPPEWRQVYMGFCRCFYEIGEYDKAIDSGMMALEMNRHFPQAHKYVALAQKESGHCDAAKATMTRAVLYEAPWDDKNLELNKALLEQLS